ncbi:MAG: metalloregulator ArsR/SmtB family transcription factor [Candidatus Eisenbacteria bacterium]
MLLQARMACLGPASRFRLALQLLAGERCVTELAAALGLSQSCTTRHLQALARQGLVRGKRAGKKVMFRLEPETAGLIDLIAAANHAPAVLEKSGTPRAARSPRGPAGTPTSRRRAARGTGPEHGRRATPESGTPPAPVAPARPARYLELEDYLL